MPYFPDPKKNARASARRRRKALVRLARDKMDPIGIYAQWMLGPQQKFHASESQTRLVIGGNRSGKTLAAAAELAMLATGTHPHGEWFPKENFRIDCVGFDNDHIRDPMWKKLARPGAIRLIKDEHTRQWRPVLPDQEYDRAYREKWRDAPPFLNEKYLNLKDTGWYEKKTDTPHIARLFNGGSIAFHSSKGAPQQGTATHLWWVDEEMENEGWVPELQRGTVSTGGRGVYSATPLTSSEQLYTLHNRANSPEGDWSVQEFFLVMDDNVYLSKEFKDEFRKSLFTEQDVQIRVYGQFAMKTLTVYPEFNRELHIVESFQPADDWCRFMVVDPGVQVCAILFAAIPPPPHIEEKYAEYDGQVHVYDESYIRRCSADSFAQHAYDKLGSHRRGGCEAFIIDGRMGRQATLSSGKTVEMYYSEALREKKIFSSGTGHGFLWGNDDIKAREESLRRWLSRNPATGQPTLQIHENCRYLIWEMGQQFYEKDKKTGAPTDKRKDKDNHLVSSLEYLADFDPYWTMPRRQNPESRIARAARHLKRKTQRQHNAIICAPLRED